MKLAKYRHPNGSIHVGLIEDFTVVPLNLSGGQYNCLADVLESDNPAEVIEFLADPTGRLSLGKVLLLPPIDQQEVWAAGVTYRRSQAARMEESTVAGDLLRSGVQVAASRAVLQGHAASRGRAEPGRSACARTRSGPFPNPN